jgi:hypothetical protein
MMETELENESVILKRQTFNAQPVFGKPTGRQAVNVQSSNTKQSAIRNPQSDMESLPSRSSQQKLLEIKRSAPAEATARQLSLSTLLPAKAGADDGI